MASVGGDEASKLEMHRQIVLDEIKHSNNRHRLLSEKLGQTVYKIPDDVWDQRFIHFQIEVLRDVKLEARPHGLTQDNTPVYTRTGKVSY